MKKTILTIAILSSFSAYADNDNSPTNSYNTQTSTQTNEITHNDTYDNHSVDSSTSTDASTDNSAYSHNNQDSYNQANKSWQTITNTNTEGDLSNSKNTGSYNTGSYNTDTSGSGNTLTANGGDAKSTLSNSGNSQQAQGQGQLQGQMQGNNNQIGGSTTQVKTGATVSKTTYAPSTSVNNNYRRIPVSTAVSMGQVAHTPYSCKPINGVGAQTPQFGISASFSRDDDFCEGMVLAEVMTQQYNMPRTGCEIAKEVAKQEHNDIVAKAMAKSGDDCSKIVPASFVDGKPAIVGAAIGIPSATARDTEARLDSLRPINPVISATHAAIMRK